MRIHDLTVRYGEQIVLDRLSLDLPDEGATFLMGPSGVGKTTLLRVLAGLQAPDSGTVELPGRPVMLFQEDRLFPDLTARRQVEVLLPRGKKGAASQLLELVELSDAGDKRPGELSGGMARRLALARCLAVEGEVLLLDEPFAGVDLDRAERILVRLRALGRPILLTGHAPQLARLCDREIALP